MTLDLNKFDSQRALVMARQLTLLTHNYVRPILIGLPPQKQVEAPILGGTITFINTGSRCFGVTNYHVIERFRQDQITNKSNICQIGEKEFDVNARVIAEDRKLDITTIEVSESEIKSLGVTPLQHITWPVKNPTIGEQVTVVGYPGILRTIDSWDQLTTPFIGIVMPIESISDKNITLQFRREFLIYDKGSADPSKITEVGGLSGSGVFILRKVLPELVGIVFNSYPKDKPIELLSCRRSDLIKKDGTINYQIAWI